MAMPFRSEYTALLTDREIITNSDRLVEHRRQLVELLFAEATTVAARTDSGAPTDAYMVSIPASSFELGAGLSPSTTAALREAVDHIVDLCDDLV